MSAAAGVAAGLVDATAGQVESALEALPNIAAVTVEASAFYPSTWYVEFRRLSPHWQV